MSLDDVFKTRTMAGILAAQGQLKKAEEILTDLLKKKPDQPDLAVELDLLRLRMNPKNIDPQEWRNDLYGIWIKIAFGYHRNERIDLREAGESKI